LHSKKEKEKLNSTVSRKIKNLDFIFENSHPKIVANRNFPEIKLAGLNIGPLEEGNEYEIPYWAACQLEKSGVTNFREEEKLDSASIYKVQWKERVQAAGKMSALPENFYPKLRRYLAELKRDIAEQPEKIREYEKTRQLACDIVNSRLKKIVSLASTPARAEQLLKNFTGEEKFIYEQLYKIISEWRVQILEYDGGEE